MDSYGIKKRAAEIAHENCSACSNRPKHMQKEHSKSCVKLSILIEEAMIEAISLYIDQDDC